MQNWYAVLTKPRLEGEAALRLRQQGFTCLYPRLRRSVRSARGMQIRTESLFPRYVFIQADPDVESLAPVRSTRGVAGLVRFGSIPAIVPDRVIEHIKSRIELESGCVQLAAPDLVPGARVRVTQGPLEGVEGIFTAHSGCDRVRVLLSLMGSEREVVLPRTALGIRL
ncbi:MAG: transcription termination/antitermination NusG family protein [Lysobacterales bacterium]